MLPRPGGIRSVTLAELCRGACYYDLFLGELWAMRHTVYADSPLLVYPGRQPCIARERREQGKSRLICYQRGQPIIHCSG
jgi:hypothetical protein